MTEKGSTSSILIVSFDAPGKTVGPWMRSVADNMPEGIWILLEQMHRFDFHGPERDSVQGLLSEESIWEYGLRGRLFWKSGQIEWRRLDDVAFRIVGISEDPEGIRPVEGVKWEAAPLEVIREEQKLILWGESRNGGAFRERRVGGSGDILYPEALNEAILNESGSSFPAMSVCVYKNLYHRTILWRFMCPAVCKEKELK